MSRFLPALLLCLVGAAAADRPAPDDPPAPAPASGETALARVSRLQGSAFLDRNRDVVGAAVIVHRMGDVSKVYLTSTDEFGRFKIEGLPDGEYRVRVERHGVAPVAKNDVSVKFPFRAVVELDMEALERGPIVPRTTGYTPQTSGTVTVRGTIRGTGGQPMGEAHVRLVRTDAAFDPQTATTDADGEFSLAEVPVGEWVATVYGVGHLPIRTTVVVDHDAEVEIGLVRQPASYKPSPLELMPVEEPIRPPGLEQAKSKI
ncbi:MAG TPA: carboxypeptidase-like regulatory domain-containing protein [Candidatus Polarisedimenticolaceae bacterium]|nr:carboxypeptidase-like regulatory domain-containing protein [Candidatus Polarisedimenticolaceae bacterium]